MVKLLIFRFDLNKKVNLVKTFFSLFVVFSISLSFSLLLIMIYDNNISQYIESSYDYKLRNFDENNISDIKKQSFSDELYTTRMLSVRLKKGTRQQSATINLVDHWDKKGISYLGNSRIVKGNFPEGTNNGIVLDILTANKLHAKIGDRVTFNINEKDISYTVIMLIEPDIENGNGIGVCLFNSYFKEKWIKEFQTEPSYSILFVSVNDLKKANHYFYDLFVGPKMEGETKKSIKEYNYQTIDEKVQEIRNAKLQMEYTPPITVIVSVLGAIFIFLFIFRENSSKMEGLQNNMAILTTLGFKQTSLVRYFVEVRCLLLIPAIGFSSLVVKKLIYDLFIIQYYLSWKVVWISGSILVIFSIITTAVVASIICYRFNKDSIVKYLTVE